MARIIDLSIFERPREKAKRFGLEQLSSAELLAIIINSGTRDESALEIANKIFNDNCGLANISKMTIGQFKSYNGIGDAKALNLSAAFELHRRIKEEKVIGKNNNTNVEKIACYFRDKFINENSEKLVVISINRKSIINEKVLSIGNEEQLITSSKLILNTIMSSSCNEFFLVHNHPSGNVHPSQSDISFTFELLSLCKRLRIKMIDHLIIGCSNYYSFSKNSISDY